MLTAPARPVVTQPSLFEQIAVHCFYGCDHVVRDPSPEGAHAAMEQHYRRQHPSRPSIEYSRRRV